ncbi:hypothetical protein J6590_043429 [Homalodisca vitripennis]|nr:hypothetical protein J6590_043429 [Homalodisca vitripennis]
MDTVLEMHRISTGQCHRRNCTEVKLPEKRATGKNATVEALSQKKEIYVVTSVTGDTVLHDRVPHEKQYCRRYSTTRYTVLQETPCHIRNEILTQENSVTGKTVSEERQCYRKDSVTGNRATEEAERQCYRKDSAIQKTERLKRQYHWRDVSTGELMLWKGTSQERRCPMKIYSENSYTEESSTGKSILQERLSHMRDVATIETMSQEFVLQEGRCYSRDSAIGKNVTGETLPYERQSYS